MGNNVESRFDSATICAWFFLLIYSTLFVCTFFVSLSERKKTKKKKSKLNNLEAKRRRPQTETLSNLSRVCVVFLFFCYNRLSKSDMHGNNHTMYVLANLHTQHRVASALMHTHALANSRRMRSGSAFNRNVLCINIKFKKLKFHRNLHGLKLLLEICKHKKTACIFSLFGWCFFVTKFFFSLKTAQKWHRLKNHVHTIHWTAAK